MVAKFFTSKEERLTSMSSPLHTSLQMELRNTQFQVMNPKSKQTKAIIIHTYIDADHNSIKN